jgi:polyadenylate-binding protein
MNPPYATASLYVGDLEPACTESMLFETFKKVGTVSSIRVCRDVETRRSLGYAYVNFHNVADAERAIDTLNYTPVGGGEKPCRIMWSHRDPSLRRSGRGNIFIKNLDKSIDHKALCDTFSAFGNILSCKVALDRDGQSRGFGFVHYENPEAADAAIEQVNGMLLCDKKVYVGEFQPRKARGDAAGTVKFTNVFVKDLPLDLTDEDLHKAFSAHGEITSHIIKRKEDGTSLGFGFVNFANVDSARNAVEEMNGAEIKGTKIFVSRAQKKAEREAQLKRQFEERKMRYAESNVFVKNLDESTDDTKLKEHFAQFGEVVSCKVMRDDKGISRGFGFVCFSTPEEAHKAIQEPHNKVLNGKPLYIALAQRKDVRTAQLQAQYAHRAAGRGMAPPMMGFMMGPQPGQRGAGPYPAPYPGMVQQVRPPRWQQGPQGGGRAQPYPQQQQGYPPVAGKPQQGQGQYVLNVNAANTPAAVAVVPAESAPHPSLADLSEKDRKQVLGEFLYPKIEVLLKTEVGGDPSETGKITGMLLESLDHGELVHLLESPAELKSRVAEAIQVLREHLAAAQQSN